MKDLPDFLRSHADREVVYQYLQQLAQRTAQLELQLVSKSEEPSRDESRTAAIPKELQPDVARMSAIAPGFCRLTTEAVLNLLPVIFEGFWSAIELDGLVLVASRLGLSSLNKRDLDASPEIVAAGVRRIGALGRDDLGALTHFCQELPPTLKVRREMDFVDLRFSALRGQR